MCGAGRTLADPVPSPDGLLVAFIAMGGGRPRLVTVPASGGPEVVLTSDPGVCGSHSHGGGVFDWSPDSRRIAYAASDGFLYVIPATGGPGAMVFNGGDVASVSISPRGDLVAFTVEEAEVVVCPLEPGGGATARVVSGGGKRGSDGSGATPQLARDGTDASGFVRDPVWHPDGSRIAWVEWEVPAMPWDSSRIACVTLDGNGAMVGAAAVLAGGPGIAVSQPRWSPDGSRIAYLSDKSGWPVVWVAEADGTGARPLGESRGVEHTEPGWGPGIRSFAWSPDARSIAVTANRGGFWSLETVEVERATPRRIFTGFCAGVVWGPAGITGIRSAPEFPPSLVWIDQRAHEVRSLARGPVGGFERDSAISVESVSWAAPNESAQEIHGRLYRPDLSRGDPPPLLVWVHGGPTGQMGVEFNARVAYFLERGWAILAPDFRGSSGWGRSYAQALHGGWGEVDVDDVAAGMRRAAEKGWGDQRAMVAMGASSGGMCVLLVLARYPELCAAGIDLYGVTDLADLALRTHRFERHYTDSMVGPLDATELYRQRSPLTHAARITKPLLVLHGDRDKVVPEAQSGALVDAIASAGGTVEYHLYEGEGHGWSRPETVADELVRITDFLDRHVLQRQAVQDQAGSPHRVQDQVLDQVESWEELPAACPPG